MIELNLTPDVSIIESIRNDSNMNLANSVSEFIDNGLDWKATRIDIVLGSEVITITDNGEGCGNLEPMLRLANHNPDGRRIGRYGVGFNLAAMWLGKAVDIKTVHSGKRSHIALRWDDLWPAWRVTMPNPTHAQGVMSGMCISISDLESRKAYSTDVLTKKLQLRYPFLAENDKTLTLNGVVIQSLILPKLEHRLTNEGIWNGHSYRLTAGLTPELIAPWRSGFTVMLRDRVLDSGKSYGCGDYGTNRFFCLVELLEGNLLPDGSISLPWKVDRTKTGITDETVQFLESLYTQVEHLLSKAENRSSSLILREIEEELSGDWLNEAIAGRVKEKRPGASKERTRGTGAGTGGGTRANARNIDDGEDGSVSIRRGIGRKVKVQFAHLEPGRLANIDHNAKRTICYLNVAHPFLESHKEPGSTALRIVVAMLVYTYWLDDSDARPRMLTQLALPGVGDHVQFEEVERAIALGLLYLTDPDELEFEEVS